MRISIVLRVADLKRSAKKMETFLFRVGEIAPHKDELWVIPKEGSRSAACAALSGGESVEVRDGAAVLKIKIASVPMTNPLPAAPPKFVVFRPVTLPVKVGAEVWLTEKTPNQAPEPTAPSGRGSS